MIDVLARHADVVQLATPGPMCMAALVAARMLRLPVVAQYHTEVADYAFARMFEHAVSSSELVAPIVELVLSSRPICCMAPCDGGRGRRAGGALRRRQRRASGAFARGVDLSLFRSGAPRSRCGAPRLRRGRWTDRAVRRAAVAREEPRRPARGVGARQRDASARDAGRGRRRPVRERARRPQHRRAPALRHGAELATQSSRPPTCSCSRARPRRSATS